MIYLPSTLTPVPRYTGYFWDVKHKKLFSLKAGGELREMTCRRLWEGVAHRSHRRPGALYYAVSHKGQRRYLFVEDLMRLEYIDYDIPVVMRKVEEPA